MTNHSLVAHARSAWSIREVARRNDLSAQFVRLEIARGKLRAKRIGRRVLIPVTAEKEWLENAPER